MFSADFTTKPGPIVHGPEEKNITFPRSDEEEADRSNNDATSKANPEARSDLKLRVGIEVNSLTLWIKSEGLKK